MSKWDDAIGSDFETLVTYARSAASQVNMINESIELMVEADKPVTKERMEGLVSVIEPLDTRLENAKISCSDVLSHWYAQVKPQQ